MYDKHVPAIKKARDSANHWVLEDMKPVTALRKQTIYKLSIDAAGKAVNRRFYLPVNQRRWHNKAKLHQVADGHDSEEEFYHFVRQMRDPKSKIRLAIRPAKATIGEFVIPSDQINERWVISQSVNNCFGLRSPLRYV